LVFRAYAAPNQALEPTASSCGFAYASGGGSPPALGCKPPAEEEPSMYPEPNRHELSETEKAQIRKRIQQGDDNIYKLAQEFGCSASQIAGIKAARHR
jgi:transposase-like protein